MKIVKIKKPKKVIKAHEITMYECEVCHQQHNSQYAAKACEERCSRKKCKHKWEFMQLNEHSDCDTYYSLHDFWIKCSVCNMSQLVTDRNLKTEIEDLLHKKLKKELKWKAYEP